jgi:hypothetical protein
VFERVREREGGREREGHEPINKKREKGQFVYMITKEP